MKRILTALLLAVAAGPSCGAPVRVRAVQYVPPAPANRSTIDLYIDTDGNVGGLQMLFTLNSGTFYQDVVGGQTAPPRVFVEGEGTEPGDFPPRPQLAYDTFVTIGGFFAETSAPVLVVGRAVNIRNVSRDPLTFSTSLLDITWAPSTGIFTGPVTNYPIARITTTQNAQGTLRLWLTSLPGTNGTLITIPYFAVPESSTALAMACAVPVLNPRRR
jgi:hypothetical protein